MAKDQGSLYRGMRPVLDSDAKDLVEKIKVTDVLVFRAPSKEIAFGDEVKMFAKVGVSKEHVFNIRFNAFLKGLVS